MRGRQVHGDTTQKFLFALRDNSFVESVLIPASPALYGSPSDRKTLCRFNAGRMRVRVQILRQRP